jgi:predicted RNA binding protein YcfA (HicA-like mRNA interferase family)
MRLPRDLSGEELAALLRRRWGYAKIHQVGSHIILQTEEPVHHRISVPAHRQPRIGTLNSILRSVASHKGVAREAILDDFG